MDDIRKKLWTQVYMYTIDSLLAYDGDCAAARADAAVQRFDDKFAPQRGRQ